MDGDCGIKHCSSNKMVDELLEMMDGECGKGTFKLKQDERCAARGELMEVMDDECKDGARKEHRSYIKIVGELLEVSCWR